MNPNSKYQNGVLCVVSRDSEVMSQDMLLLFQTSSFEV